jgi:hypothetical protein
MKTRQNSMVGQRTAYIFGAAIIGVLLASGNAHMLVITLSAVIVATPAIIKSASLKLKPCKI